MVFSYPDHEHVTHEAGREDNMSKITIHQGDALMVLRSMPEESVHCVITSPPYWGLRDYGLEPIVWGGQPDHIHTWSATPCPDGNGDGLSLHRDKHAGRQRDATSPGFCECGAWRGCLGLEPTPELYVEHLLEIFQKVRRVLRKDGTLWLNIGDSYATGAGQGFVPGGGGQGNRWKHETGHQQPNRLKIPGLKPKDLCMIPARVALALQADGWYLRSDIIWQKNNPQPESVMDRPTKAHEHIFFLAKSEHYYYDTEAIKEPAVTTRPELLEFGPRPARNYPGHINDRRRRPSDGQSHKAQPTGTRNRRSVWTISLRAYKGAHFATFPLELPTICIKAGTSERGCCSRCGTPRKRIVESIGGRDWRNDRMVRIGIIDEKLGEDSNKRGRSHEPLNNIKKQITLGWQSSCSCKADDSIPAVVLDPFFGAGTTGLAAAGLLRDCIGIELNPKYCEMARRRIKRAYGMFVDIRSKSGLVILEKLEVRG